LVAEAAAEAAGVSERTARKWVARLRSERDAGLHDRSSAPKRIPHRTPAERVELITALRRVRMTTAEISEALGMALSTVSCLAEADRAARSRYRSAVGGHPPARDRDPLLGVNLVKVLAGRALAKDATFAYVAASM
jgi:transposase